MTNIKPIDYIYALCKKDGPPFYVGRTSDMGRRLKEHKYESRFGTEAKYQYIRELEINGVEWEMILLDEVIIDRQTIDVMDRYEDFWVYTLAVEGYDLQNMKAGDSIRAANSEAMRSLCDRGEKFTTVSDFFVARKKEKTKLLQAKKKAAELQERMRAKKAETCDHSRTLFQGEKLEEKFMSPGLRRILAKRKVI